MLTGLKNPTTLTKFYVHYQSLIAFKGAANLKRCFSGSSKGTANLKWCFSESSKGTENLKWCFSEGSERTISKNIHRAK